MDVERACIKQFGAVGGRFNVHAIMRCFCHPDQEALGTCRCCGKGVCAACLIDFGKGLACRDQCGEDVKGLIELVDYNLRRFTGPALVSISATKPPSEPVGPSTDYLATHLWIHIQRTNRSRYWSGGFSIIIGAVVFAAGLEYHTVVAFVGSCFLFFGLTTLWDARQLSKRSPLADWHTK
ncbi:MAG: hypothetical protein JWO89_69 [Verrucomicrobiaceae bacterium]|nr:hypothetical protein [Verrucomicrobiaceae bacterium]